MAHILVTGSRTWSNAQIIEDAIAEAVDNFQGEHVVVVSGHCPKGADLLCEFVSRRMNLSLKLYPADWENLGKRAGFVRNAEMVNQGADLCLAFIRNNSKGATMTAELAEKAGIPTIVFRENDSMIDILAAVVNG